MNHFLILIDCLFCFLVVFRFCFLFFLAKSFCQQDTEETSNRIICLTIHIVRDKGNKYILISWIRLRGPVIQANGRLTYEDDMRSGGLL